MTLPGTMTVAKSIGVNFMGTASTWYKLFVVVCLIINPFVFWASPFAAGWLLVAEFIFTLAMALECYPLQPGGMLALEACFLGMCTMDGVKNEIIVNIDVILLLMFMLGGIHFVRDFLLYIFTKILVKVKNSVLISFLFCFVSGTLAAFVDALTVLAVIISICMGLYAVYHAHICGDAATARLSDDVFVQEKYRKDLEDFRAFLRGLLMNAAVGTTIGGMATLVGQPQNLVVGQVSGWNFVEFLVRMAPVSLPVMIFGYGTCLIVEKFKLFGFGAEMPKSVYEVLVARDKANDSNMTLRDKVKLVVQALCCVWLVIALALHLAAVGLIGLSIIVLATTFCGITTDSEVGRSCTGCSRSRARPRSRCSTWQTASSRRCRTTCSSRPSTSSRCMTPSSTASSAPSSTTIWPSPSTPAPTCRPSRPRTASPPSSSCSPPQSRRSSACHTCA